MNTKIKLALVALSLLGASILAQKGLKINHEQGVLLGCNKLLDAVVDPRIQSIANIHCQVNGNILSIHVDGQDPVELGSIRE